MNHSSSTQQEKEDPVNKNNKKSQPESQKKQQQQLSHYEVMQQEKEKEKIRTLCMNVITELNSQQSHNQQEFQEDGQTNQLEGRDNLYQLLSQMSEFSNYFLQNEIYQQQIMHIIKKASYCKIESGELVNHKIPNENIYIILSGEISVYVPKLIEEIIEEQSIRQQICKVQQEIVNYDVNSRQYFSKNKLLSSLNQQLNKYWCQQDISIVLSNPKTTQLFFTRANTQIAQFKKVSHLHQGQVFGRREWQDSSKKMFSFLTTTTCEFVVINNSLFNSIFEGDKLKQLKQVLMKLNWIDLQQPNQLNKELENNNEDNHLLKLQLQQGDDLMSSWFQEKVVQRKIVVFNEGDPVDNIYIVKSGQLEIFKTQQTNQNIEESTLQIKKSSKRQDIIPLSILEKGDVFGFEDMRDKKRSYGVICSSGNTVLYYIPATIFKEIITFNGFQALKAKTKLKKQWISDRFEEVIAMKALSCQEMIKLPKKKKKMKKRSKSIGSSSMNQISISEISMIELEKSQQKVVLQNKRNSLEPHKQTNSPLNLNRQSAYTNQLTRQHSQPLPKRLSDSLIRQQSQVLQRMQSHQDQQQQQEVLEQQLIENKKQQQLQEEQLQFFQPKLKEQHSFSKYIAQPSLFFQKSHRQQEQSQQQQQNQSLILPNGRDIPKFQRSSSTGAESKTLNYLSKSQENISKEDIIINSNNNSQQSKVFPPHSQSQNSNINNLDSSQLSNKNNSHNSQNQTQNYKSSKKPKYSFFDSGLNFKSTRKWVIQSKKAQLRMPPAQTPVFSSNKPDYAAIINYCFSKRNSNRNVRQELNQMNETDDNNQQEQQQSKLIKDNKFLGDDGSNINDANFDQNKTMNRAHTSYSIIRCTDPVRHTSLKTRSFIKKDSQCSSFDQLNNSNKQSLLTQKPTEEMETNHCSKKSSELLNTPSQKQNFSQYCLSLNVSERQSPFNLSPETSPLLKRKLNHQIHEFSHEPQLQNSESGKQSSIEPWKDEKNEQACMKGAYSIQARQIKENRFKSGQKSLARIINGNITHQQKKLIVINNNNDTNNHSQQYQEDSKSLVDYVEKQKRINQNQQQVNLQKYHHQRKKSSIELDNSTLQIISLQPVQQFVQLQKKDESNKNTKSTTNINSSINLHSFHKSLSFQQHNQSSTKDKNSSSNLIKNSMSKKQLVSPENNNQNINKNDNDISQIKNNYNNNGIEIFNTQKQSHINQDREKQQEAQENLQIINEDILQESLQYQLQQQQQQTKSQFLKEQQEQQQLEQVQQNNQISINNLSQEITQMFNLKKISPLSSPNKNKQQIINNTLKKHPTTINLAQNSMNSDDQDQIINDKISFHSQLQFKRTLQSSAAVRLKKDFRSILKTSNSLNVSPVRQRFLQQNGKQRESSPTEKGNRQIKDEGLNNQSMQEKVNSPRNFREALKKALFGGVESKIKQILIIQKQVQEIEENDESQKKERRESNDERRAQDRNLNKSQEHSQYYKNKQNDSLQLKPLKVTRHSVHSNSNCKN